VAVGDTLDQIGGLFSPISRGWSLAAVQGESESYVPALARALGKVNGVQIGPKT
jgi:hypothetical protein